MPHREHDNGIMAQRRSAMNQLCRELKVWQRAMDLMVESFRLSAKLPREARFELGSQIRRAAVSIPANIAEGNARRHRKEYLRFLAIARGSHSELSTLFEAARRVGYLTEMELAPAFEMLDHVGRMLTRLIARLKEVGGDPTGTPNLPSTPDSRLPSR
jgi:four helix bundle protein